jgi:hypothetical protein
MRLPLAALALLGLAACTQPQSDADAVVRDIYATAQEHVGRTATPHDAIPMSNDLRALVDRAEAAADAREEPFIDGDLALDCQDCSSIDDLVIGPQRGPYNEPTEPGHHWVQASFTLNGDTERTILWDMIETPEGWRVHNILTEGFNLRTEAAAYLADADAPAEAPAAP